MSRISDADALEQLENLKNNGYWFWTSKITSKNNVDPRLQELITTREVFRKILEDNSSFQIVKSLLNASTPLTLALSLTHLMRATDGSAELLDRLKDYIIFNNISEITIIDNQKHDFKYEFKSIGKTFKKQLKNAEILKADIYLAEDIITILLFGSQIKEFQDFITLKKLSLGKIIGNKKELTEYFGSLYLKVSRQSAGITSATSGTIPQKIVLDSIEKDCKKRNDITKVSNNRIKGIGSDPNGREFDLVYEIKKEKSANVFVAIEVAFQETTNSVIERKSREAVNLFPILHKKGYHLCFAVDGAGYFSRKKALKDIIKYSHLCVTFKELDKLGQYIQKL